MQNVMTQDEYNQLKLQVADLEASNAELRQLIYGDGDSSWGIWDGKTHHVWCNYQSTPLGEKYCNCPIGKALYKARQDRDNYERWWKAVDELGVVNWTLIELDDPNPYEALKRIIEFDVQIALDPAVSGDARALYEDGRQDGLKECQQSRSK